MEGTRKELWERQEGESKQAFEAFLAYAEMGNNFGKRSIRKVAQQLGKSATLISRWSVQHSWQKRVEAYDENALKEYQAKRKKEAQAAIDRRVKTSQAIEGIATSALRYIKPNEMSPKEIKELLKLAMEMQDKILFSNTANEPQKQTTSKQEAETSVKQTAKSNLSNLTTEELKEYRRLKEKTQKEQNG